MSPLLELAERVEAATGPSHELDLAIADACYTHGIGGVNYDPALWVERYGGHSGSIDAAMTLAISGVSAADVLRHAIKRCSRYGTPTFIEALPRFVASEWLRAHASGEME